MITRTLACGDLLNYLAGPVNSNGKKREEAAELVRGSREKAVDFLNAVAPFKLRDAKRRRWFYPRACLHIVHNFAEARTEVQDLILPIVRGTEDILLAGMRRDALAFITYYHPQELHPHPHIGLIKFVHPYAGPYNPGLGLPEEDDLLKRYAHLCNLNFGLDDPMDPKHARLIHPGRGCFKSQFFDCFKKIDQLARDLLAKGMLNGRSFPSHLQSIGVKPIVAYAKNGKPSYFSIVNGLENQSFKACKDALVVLTPDCQQLVLRGMLVRVDFTAVVWNEEINRRRAFMENLHEHGVDYYREFLGLIEKRGRRQSALYPQAGIFGPAVGVADFGWLKPITPQMIVPPSPLTMDL
jgi:hypothetical protein